MKATFRLVTASSCLLIVGCTSFDSSSQFDDVASSVKERRHYVQVVTKSITPDIQVLSGANVVKASANYVANYPVDKSAGPDVAPSKLMTEISYFKNYQEYETVTINGETLPLENTQVTSETCTEHCVTTQYVSFPFSPDIANNWSEPQVTYTFNSAGGGNRVQLSIPNAYFMAANDEASRVLGQQSQSAVSASQPISVKDTKEKPEEMVDYWYQQATDSERSAFADWAFAHRDGSGVLPTTQSKALQMMGYWYQQATPTSRKAILTWLLNQS
ncbi:hypothetical protein BZG20_01895 [Salinivibrio sp. IB868]|uniref:DUF2057 family protein n=1 Tax=unclassified Salinivibrio TaxID=2636825 RepID=UPI00098701D2|nr:MULTISPECIES: DUF2057 family protein [unclassified Salinivibrio]OOE69702.1 hypothetical protein BZG20_01895 [Salinivibrio sp. IB868]OOE73463.1 hypothetical protein BZG22_10095 [Salinivibrio sp. IB870]